MAQADKKQTPNFVITGTKLVFMNSDAKQEAAKDLPAQVQRKSRDEAVNKHVEAKAKIEDILNRAKRCGTSESRANPG